MPDERPGAVITLGRLSVDPALRLVHLSGQSVNLTRTEFMLLMYLIENRHRVVPTRELLREVWGSDWLKDTANLQVHMSRLRSKLHESANNQGHIQTVHGVGYRLAADRQDLHEDAQVTDAPTLQSTHAKSEERRVELTYDKEFFLREIQPSEEFLGWDPKDLLNTQFLVTGADPEHHVKAVKALISGGMEYFATEVPARLANGQTQNIPVRTTLFRDSDGQFAGARVVFHFNVEDDHGLPES